MCDNNHSDLVYGWYNHQWDFLEVPNIKYHCDLIEGCDNDNCGLLEGCDKIIVNSSQNVTTLHKYYIQSVSCDALSAYINDVHSINANCEKLITKYNTYASFKVDVTCNDMSTFLHPDKWPQGVYLRKLFNNNK